jgi:tRNA modification GTPase
VEGIKVSLIDTAGLRDNAGTVEAAAQSLGRDQQRQADLVIWCRETWRTDGHALPAAAPSDSLSVWTKGDLAAAPGAGLVTSAATGLGLAELKKVIAARARERATPGLAPSLTRCRHHVDNALACLRRGHAIVLEEGPAELLALEVRMALDEVGAMAGAIFTEDLLDRIFSRFCIGK